MRRRWRSIDISGTTPEPPPTSSAGLLAAPDEVGGERAADLDLVAHLDDVVEVRRDLAVLEAVDRQLDLALVERGGGDRVRALGAGIRRARSDALHSAGRAGAASTSAPRCRNDFTRGVSRLIAMTVPSCQCPGARCSTGVSRADGVNRPVPLLLPWVAAVVVAVRLPEAGLVVVHHASPCTHLALFQKYRWGTSSRAGPPCSRGSGAPSYSVTTHALPPVRSSIARLVV